MSTWIKEKSTKSWIYSFCENVLKCGNIPKHIAIIMDGNRRFAVKKKYERCVGHLLGFNKVSETLEWCAGLGVKEVTLYAFSLENFKRSKDEVDCLMEMAKQKFSALLDEKDLVMSHSLCVRIIGNLTYLPADLQAILAQVIDITKYNNKLFLNVCCAYTSQEEMTQSMMKMKDGVAGGLIVSSDIDESLFEKSLYTSQCSEPDILIRTSGEVRLSDFLLWQTSYSMLSFTKVLWPEFSRWHLYLFILHYQLNHHDFIKAREEREVRRKKQRHETDCKVVRHLLKHSKRSSLLKHLSDYSHLDDLVRKLKIDVDQEDTCSLVRHNNSVPGTTPIDSTTTNLMNNFLASTPNLYTENCTEEEYGELLEAVVECRKRRCSRYIEKLKSNYDSFISHILKVNACREDADFINNNYNKVDGLKKRNGYKDSVSHMSDASGNDIYSDSNMGLKKAESHLLVNNII